MCIGMLNSSGERAAEWGYSVVIMDFHQIFLGKSVIYIVVSFSISAGEARIINKVRYMKTATRIKKAYLYRTVYSCSVAPLLL